MDGGQLYLGVARCRPFLSDKYDITRHPNFKIPLILNILSARPKVKPDEVCDVYEVDTEGCLPQLPLLRPIGVQSGQSSTK